MLFRSDKLNLLQSTRRGRRGGNRNGAPIAVITVPTLFTPTFSVPVQFSVSASGPVGLPSFLTTLNVRITSVRCTAISSATGTVIINFKAALPSTGGLTDVTRESRIVPVGNSPIELVMRQDNRVQHGTFNPLVLVPSLIEFVISGTVTVTGVYMVSVMGPV